MHKIVEEHPQLAGIFVSLAAHLLLFGGGWAFFQSAQYGVERGSGGLQIDWVAAPRTAISTEGVDLPLTEETLILPDVEFKTPSKVHAARAEGDGSSEGSGQDSTTLYSPGGGQTEAQPTALKNPAPPYPEAARRRGQEGLVALRIAIDRTGRPTLVEIQRSSGYLLLDESARTAIGRWLFIPARILGKPRDSVASLQVRFALKEGD